MVKLFSFYIDIGERMGDSFQIIKRESQMCSLPELETIFEEMVVRFKEFIKKYKKDEIEKLDIDVK